MNRLLNLRLIRQINRINRFQVVYFSRGDNLAALEPRRPLRAGE